MSLPDSPLPRSTPLVTPRVTVLMPAYNSAAFLAEALSSVLQQTVHDFEVIVVDDGSTDETFEIASGFAQRDARIMVLRQANQGIGAARNAAFARARGQWLALLDSDDFWFPTYLAEQLAILERHPEIDVLSANAMNVGGAWDGTPYKRTTADAPYEVRLLELVQHEDSVCILSLVRCRMLAALGGFDATLRGSEDYDVWLRATASEYRIFFNPRVLGGYRRRADSVSADELRMLAAIVIPLRALRARALPDPVLQSAIDRQLLRFSTRRQVVLATNALRSGERRRLAECLHDLHRQTGQWRYRVGGVLCRLAPELLSRLYRWKSRRAARRLARDAARCRQEGFQVPQRPTAGRPGQRGLNHVP
jgi:glycosyltransferase involved in cell wall biosynthesis